MVQRPKRNKILASTKFEALNMEGVGILIYSQNTEIKPPRSIKNSHSLDPFRSDYCASSPDIPSISSAWPSRFIRHRLLIAIFFTDSNSSWIPEVCSNCDSSSFNLFLRFSSCKLRVLSRSFDFPIWFTKQIDIKPRRSISIAAHQSETMECSGIMVFRLEFDPIFFYFFAFYGTGRNPKTCSIFCSSFVFL